MASELKQIPPLPAAQAALVDPRNGMIDPQTWYLYLKRLDDHVREIERRLDGTDNEIQGLDARVSDLETP